MKAMTVLLSSVPVMINKVIEIPERPTKASNRSDLYPSHVGNIRVHGVILKRRPQLGTTALDAAPDDNDKKEVQDNNEMNWKL